MKTKILTKALIIVLMSLCTSCVQENPRLTENDFEPSSPTPFNSEMYNSEVIDSIQKINNN